VDGSLSGSAIDPPAALPCAPLASSDTSIAAFWRLVRPHALPRLPELVAVLLLGAVASAGTAAALLLVTPILHLLFPGLDSSALGGRRAEDQPNQLELRIAALSRWFAERVPDVDPMLPTVFAVGAVLATIGVVTALATFGSIHLARMVALGMVIDLRQRLARHLMGLSVRYHGSRRFGDLLSRISADVQATLNTVDVALKELVREPVEVVLLVGVAIYAAPELAVVVLLAMPLVALPVALLSRKVRKGSTRSLTSLGASVQALSQMFSGVRTVKAFRAEERELDGYRRLNQGYLRNARRMVRAVALSQAWTAFFSMLGFALLLVAIGLLKVYSDAFDKPDELIIFLVAISQAHSKLKRATNAVTRVQESLGASTRLQALLDEPVDVVEPTDPVPLRGLGSGLRLESVSLRYPDTPEPALSAVDLVVRPGEKLALVGPSGSGKSTLVDLLARFLDPTAGRITVDGVDLRQVSLDDWTANYAMVGQVPFLFHATIGENLRYGKPDATAEEVRAAARAAQIHDFIESLPQGYDTDVADAGARLSGGQRQRIAIARALLKGAPLLLLDEATSALDSESEAAVQGALDELMRGRTVVVVAHRLSTVRNADRIAVFEAGRLVELGSHAELLSRDGVYSRLHALQQVP
jgi:subfamily B ATP-binding cassette protein MsbA